MFQMKKFNRANMAKSVFFVAMASLMSVVVNDKAHATIRRVFYWGTPTSLDYTSIQNAVNAAVTGDTIYIFPNTQNNYVTITKKLVILGDGYGSSLNQSSGGSIQTLSGNSQVGQLKLNAGSDGSVVSGLDFNADWGIYINGSSNNKISRCCISNNSIYIDGNTTGNSVIGCYFNSASVIINQTSNSSSTSNLTISNNIFTGSYSTNINQYGAGLTGIISNNVFGDAYQNTGWRVNINLTNGAMLIENNISNGLNLTQVNCILENNIGSGTEWPTGNGNQQNVTPSSIFSFLSTDFPDSRFKLKSGSPALSAGQGGVDCGIFGGPTPYSILGVPNIPTIYNVAGPQQSSGGVLNLTVSARANN